MLFLHAYSIYCRKLYYWFKFVGQLVQSHGQPWQVFKIEDVIDFLQLDCGICKHIYTARIPRRPTINAPSKFNKI